MKYILTECVNRDLNLPVIFNTLKDAQYEMAGRIADNFKIHIENLLAANPTAEELFAKLDSMIHTEDVGIFSNYTGAWISQSCGNTCDWHIFELNSDDACHYIVNI